MALIKEAIELLNGKCFISGKLVSAMSKKVIATIDPSNGNKLADIAACDESDVDVAVKAAKIAFETNYLYPTSTSGSNGGNGNGNGNWAVPNERKKILLRFADLIDENRRELALLDTYEAGKPISDTTELDIPDSANTIRYHAEAIDKLHDQVAPTGPNNMGLIVREPIGVVGCITPWNYPALMAAWKIGPALATGNSVILKPSEYSSLSSIRMAVLASQAGVPNGIFNVVTGLGDPVGKAIALHPDVGMVSFTGSTAVGRAYLNYSAASNMKRISLEMGGKSPQLIFPDIVSNETFFETVMDNICMAAFWNMSENCSCGSRLLVPSHLKERIISSVIKRIESQWHIGDPLDQKTRLGPMITEAHGNKVMSYINKGVSQGGVVRYGGKRLLESSGGFFIQPTIIDNVKNSDVIAQEEIFGPVLSVITFDSIDEAISIANDSKYGLACTLYTLDINTAQKASRRIRSGNISVNHFSEGDLTTPFGGYKQSGFGGRDKSIFAHDQYTELKTIYYKFNF